MTEHKKQFWRRVARERRIRLERLHCNGLVDMRNATEEAFAGTKDVRVVMSRLEHIINDALSTQVDEMLDKLYRQLCLP